jgi:hypothetical protein
MKNKLIPIFIGFLLAGMLFQTSGCVAIIAGGAAGGGTAYVMGDLEANVEATAKDMRSAIEEGASDLGLRKISGSGDELEGKYVYRTGGDRKVSIRYASVGPKVMELKIRIGTFGDEAFSRQIYDAIKKRL